MLHSCELHGTLTPQLNSERPARNASFRRNPKRPCSSRAFFFGRTLKKEDTGDDRAALTSVKSVNQRADHIEKPAIVDAPQVTESPMPVGSTVPDAKG
jgi:hypothetical protein